MARNRRQRAVTSGAPPRSLYRKIQVVLVEVRRGRNASLDSLVEQIIGRGHLDFTRYKAAPDHSTSLVPCSKESVFRVIQFCEQLRLLDTSRIELTPLGLKAVDERSFNETIRKSVQVALSELGTPIKQIKTTIAEMLANSNKDSLPTADALYERLGDTETAKSREEFKIYLSLLGLCEGISFSRKKIYLP